MFSDRTQAGQLLAERLENLAGTDAVVVGLPRGGVPVAYEVATACDLPLDVIVVRKIGVPWQPELAMGAVGEEGVAFVDSKIVRAAGVDPDELAQARQTAGEELQRRVALIRSHRPRVPLAGRTVIVVDDGIATGATAKAACQVARAYGARRVIVATPVGSSMSIDALVADADHVVCLLQPTAFHAVGEWYTDFDQTTDREMIALLELAAAQQAGFRGDVEIRHANVLLQGHLKVPTDAVGVVVFAHGSGSSRHSPRNRYVAAELGRAQLGTLLFDLLTPEEETQRANVFDISLLAERLGAVVRWVRERPECAETKVGLFGASTGAGAALWTASQQPMDVDAVVSRGGRPDLAAQHLSRVQAPTLLIVGGDDEDVLHLNRSAQQRLQCTNRLAVIPGAGHLFEEPGTLREAARQASDWFLRYLAPEESLDDTPGSQRRPIGL